MQERNYKSILYFISAVIIVTLAIQVYWNYKNYQIGKQQLVNDVQVSLDNAVNLYYENKVKKDSFHNFTFNPSQKNTSIFDPENFKAILSNKGKDVYTKNEHTSVTITTTDTTGFEKTLSISGDGYISSTKIDSIKSSVNFNKNETPFFTPKISDSGIVSFKFSSFDSLRSTAIKNLTSRVFISVTEDSLNTNTIDSLFTEELRRKDIVAKQTIYFKNRDSLSTREHSKNTITAVSRSALLSKNNTLEVRIPNTALVILKRNMIGILLSIILLGAVIGSLLYLLHIIQQQKQLAEIKNDFISNMTHEFKTPIATIGVAMESIQHFNASNDMEKTKKYVEMSSQQVGKLNEMVEKLLETATINSEALALNKQEINMVELLESIQQKYTATQPEKEIVFDPKDDNIWIPVDAFHLENALDNIVDNAIKYGGNTIKITVQKLKSNVQIAISDSGNELTKTQVSQIFEKFYRVPKGNTHDVKGFGIGLYYTKVIIEKHEGSISVDTNPTQFKILLPYV